MKYVKTAVILGENADLMAKMKNIYKDSKQLSALLTTFCDSNRNNFSMVRWFCSASWWSFIVFFLLSHLVRSLTFSFEATARGQDRKCCLWSFLLFKLITCPKQQALLAVVFINSWSSFVLGQLSVKIQRNPVPSEGTVVRPLQSG